MTTVPVSLKVRKEIVEIAEEMVRLGIARSRNHAFNIILEKGIREVRKLVEKEKKVKEIVEFIEKRGGLELGSKDSSRELAEMRERVWST